MSKTGTSAPLVTDVQHARSINRLLFPQSDRINVRIDERRGFWEARLALAEGDPSSEKRRQAEILSSTADAGLIFLANMAARYGSTADDFDWGAYDHLDSRLDDAGCRSFPRGLRKCFLPYHQAEHLIWMADRLVEIYQNFEDFHFERCCVLSMSVGPHDLEQLLPGVREDGIGWNEWCSGEEARRVMLGAGFDPDRHANLIERVQMNIYGTTFSFDKSNGYVGACAPILAQRIREKYPDWRDDPRADEEIEDLLLTADVDTSALTDFAEYAETAVLLCRETFVSRAGVRTCPPVPALGFLTAAQRRFWELQAFNSRYAKALFQERKEANRPLMEALVGRMEEEFRVSDGQRVVDKGGIEVDDGEVIMAAFLEYARELHPAGNWQSNGTGS